jgi:hypothetical protein
MDAISELEQKLAAARDQTHAAEVGLAKRVVQMRDSYQKYVEAPPLVQDDARFQWRLAAQMTDEAVAELANKRLQELVASRELIAAMKEHEVFGAVRKWIDCTCQSCVGGYHLSCPALAKLSLVSP